MRTSEPPHQHQTNPDAIWRFHQFAPNAAEKSGRAFSVIGATGQPRSPNALPDGALLEAEFWAGSCSVKSTKPASRRRPLPLPYSHHRIAMFLVKSGWTLRSGQNAIDVSVNTQSAACAGDCGLERQSANEFNAESDANRSKGYPDARARRRGVACGF